MAVYSSSICNMATIISAQKRLKTCKCPNARIQMIQLYIQFLPSVSVLRSLFIILYPVEKHVCPCLSWVLRFSLWQVRDPDMTWILHSRSPSHHDLSVLCTLTLLLLCVHVYVRMWEHAQIMCHIFPGECLIPVTASSSSSSVRKWQLSLTRIPLTSLFMLAHSVTSLFHFSPPLLYWNFLNLSIFTLVLKKRHVR